MQVRVVIVESTLDVFFLLFFPESRFLSSVEPLHPQHILCLYIMRYRENYERCCPPAPYGFHFAENKCFCHPECIFDSTQCIYIISTSEPIFS